MPFARLHLWQIQAVRDLVFVLFLVWIVRLGYQLSLVTVPLLLGILLAYLLEPVIAPLARRTHRAFSAALVIAAFALFIVIPMVVGLGIAAVQGVELARKLERNWPRVVERVEVWFEKQGIETRTPAEKEAAALTVEGDDLPRGPTDPVAAASESAPPEQEGADEKKLLPRRIAGLPIPLALREHLAGVDVGGVAAGAQDVLAAIWKAVVGAGMFLFKYVFLTATFFFFSSVGLQHVSRSGPSMVPRASRERVVSIARKMNRAIAGFVRGRLVIALILTGLHTLGYWLVGVPAPILFGVAVGVLTIVPYLSVLGWIGSTIAFAVAQAGASEPAAWWWILLGPALVYAVLQPVDDYVLTPRIQGEQTGLSTPVVLFAAIGGGALAGVYGVLLAIPVAACLKIFVVEVLWPPYREWVEGRSEDPLPLDPEPSPDRAGPGA